MVDGVVAAGASPGGASQVKHISSEDVDALIERVEEQASPHWTGTELTDHEVGYIDGLRKAAGFIRSWWESLP